MPRGSTHAARARDPLLWPFASTSIWNMPIGQGAQFVPAQIEASKQIGNFAEEEIIILEADRTDGRPPREPRRLGPVS